MWVPLDKPDRFQTSDRASCCEGKQKFDSRHVARQVAEKSKKGMATTYRCRFCGYWHPAAVSLTEKKRRKK